MHLPIMAILVLVPPLPATANLSNSGSVQTIKSWYSAYCTQSLNPTLKD